MSIHTMANKTNKSTGKPEDIGELKEEEEKDKETLTEDLTSDINVLGQFTVGDWTHFVGRSKFILPLKDQKTIATILNVTKAEGYTMNAIPIASLSEEAQTTSDGSLRGAVLREVEKHCILRSNVTNAGVQKAFSKMRGKVFNKGGKRYTVLRLGAFRFQPESYVTETSAAVSGSDIVQL